MTANELADKLDLIRIELTIQAATMLRQQQAEIEALKLRDLTDEEIDELANKYLYVLNDIPYVNDIKDFSKAILQKASEK